MAIAMKKRNPQDATLRNVRAAQKDLAALKRALGRLWTTVDKLRVVVGTQEARLRALEAGRARGR